MAQPKGSSRAFIVKGRAVVTGANAKERGWRERVALVASEAMQTWGEAWTCPVSVLATFYLQRPQGHYGKKGLKPSAPSLPGVKPDADKLARSLCDALEKIVYHHDALVTSLTVQKVYADEGNPPGVRVSIKPSVADEQFLHEDNHVTQENLPGVAVYTFEVPKCDTK